METFLGLFQGPDWLAWVFIILLAALLVALILYDPSSTKRRSDTPQNKLPLPPVYTAQNVQRGRNYEIWCPTAGRWQYFQVRHVEGEWFEVKVAEPGNVLEGWTNEVPSDTLLRQGHLLNHPPKQPLHA